MSPAPKINIGLLGLGTVGTGVYKILSSLPDYTISQIAVRDLKKARSVDDIDTNCLSASSLDVVQHPDIHIVVEVMGGVEAAKDAVMAALKNKKHVVTANKELIAKFGPELFQLAKENNVRLLFEGAVAGGIPIIMPLKLSLAGNRILEIAGILNGTTNFILTKMTQGVQEKNPADYADVLKQAQTMGFAEADPSSDVDGHDTAYKISILASLAFQRQINSEQMFREGITQLTALDIQNAMELGYIIKLIGLTRQAAGTDNIEVRVHPMLIAKQHPLAHIHLENNAIWVKGDAVGDVMFYGKGAGEMPTASAVMGDILAIGSELLRGNDPIPLMAIDVSAPANMVPMTDTQNRYYIRLNTKDLPGVVGQLGTVCGELGVSIESLLQKGTRDDGTASIVLMTHHVQESAMQQALEKIRHLPTVQNVACLIRVLDE